MSEQQEFYEQKQKYEIDSSELFDATKKGENILVIDTRTEHAYDSEHIPDAISIPHKDITEKNTQYLDKNTLYVTYCNGIECNASLLGALNLSKLGFKVKELIGGLDWWKKVGYATIGINVDSNNQFCGC